MVQSLRNVFTSAASPHSFDESDVSSGTTVKVGDWVNIAEKQGNSNRGYGAGFGPNDRRTNSQGWSDLDLVLTNDGGTTNHPAKGYLRYAIYGDTEKDNLIATSGTFRAPVLKSAVTANATDKVLIPGLYSDLAGQDSVLALQYKAVPEGDGGASEDGWTVDADTASDYGLAVGQIPL